MNSNPMRPEICVSNLLNGQSKWFDANQDYDNLYEEIAEFIEKPDADFLIGGDDFQVIATDDFGKWEPTKFQSNNLCLIAGTGKAIAEYGYAFSVYITDIEKITEWDDEIVEKFQESFFGEFSSMKEFIEGYLDVYCFEELNKPFLLGTLNDYIDYKEIETDLENQYQVIKVYSSEDIPILQTVYVFGDE